MAHAVAVETRVMKQAVLTKAVVNAAVALDLPKGKVARILGVSPATVSRLFASGYSLSPERKEWEFGILLVRLFRSLDSIVGGSGEDARRWLYSANASFSGKMPAELIDSTEGLVRVVTYLDACRSIV